jgi:CSLREA domain-containing protein
VLHKWLLPSLDWRWLRVLAALALTAAMLRVALPTYAAALAVSKTADTSDGACDADCSLREAIVAANAAPGADTITVPAGVYQFTRTGNDDVGAVGDLDITDSLTIIGAGAATTIIDGQDIDRVFDIASTTACACTVAFSGITITNGSANATNFNVGGAIYIGAGVTASISDSTISSSSATGSGAGIEARGAHLTLANVTFLNNDAVASGGAVRAISSLTISGSSFVNNEAEFGGAIALAQDNAKTISIIGSSFTGNHTASTAGGSADDGGAIYADIDAALTLVGNTFTGNSAVNNGGALFLQDNATAGTGTLSASYNRIVGNSAASGNGLFRASGTAIATKNWWGCNAGPAAAPCVVVQGTVDVAPWIVLRHAASPAALLPGGHSTLTADFRTNSDGSANQASDLGALIGLPISFGNTALGTLAGAQPAIQSTGAATATYTAGSSVGAGSADATVDAQTATATITITSVRYVYLPLAVNP